MAKKKGTESVPLTPGGKNPYFKSLQDMAPNRVFPYTPLTMPIWRPMLLSSGKC